MPTKQEARRSMAAVLAAMAGDEVTRRSRRASERMLASRWWRASTDVLTYLSMPGEMDTSALVAAGLAEGKTVAAPVIDGPDIFFRVIRAPFEDLPRDPLGIPQPDPSGPRWVGPGSSAAGPILVVTPGIAFDPALHRLGRGKGFYDRFLARLRSRSGLQVFAIALAFDVQVIPEVPFDDHDAPLDGIVTDSRVIGS